MSESTEATETAEGETEIEYDIETYQHTIEEARRTLDQQLQAFNDVSKKGWRIVQLNGIIATIYVSAIANSLDNLTLSNSSLGVIGFGLVFMALSVFYTMTGQEAEDVKIGQGPKAFESVRENDPEEIAYLYKTIDDYESWIENVSSKTEYNKRVVNISKMFLLVGVGFITIGTFLAIV
jgi:hypothetical protein